MERLTERINEHVYYTKGRYEDTIPAECETGDVRNILQRLAAYEDTGLKPDEIEALKREYLKICSKHDSCPFIRTFSHGQGCYCGLEKSDEH